MHRNTPTWFTIALFAGALYGCASMPPAYQPPISPPQIADIQTIQPFLPGGRWAVVDRFATWGHKSAVRSALSEGTPVPPVPASTVASSGSRVGILTLTTGIQINYLIYTDFSGMTRVRLRYPSGVIVSLELPEEEEEDEEENEDC
ncbi:MAG: hypothetical protein ACR2PZ_16265 [Pseudomonadales bacterium]